MNTSFMIVNIFILAATAGMVIGVPNLFVKSHEMTFVHVGVIYRG